LPHAARETQKPQLSAATLGFTARPAVSAANVVSVDTVGWNEQDNVLYSLGRRGIELPTSYNFGILEWYVAFPDLPTCERWAGQTPKPAGVCLETGRSILQLTGAVSGDALALNDPLSALAGAVNVPAGGVFTTAGMLSGFVRTPVPPGPLVVATLTLHISGRPARTRWG